MEKSEWVVAPEAAIAEFERFANAWAIDTDLESMIKEEDQDSFNAHKRKIVLQIQSGALTIDDTGQELRYMLQYPKTQGIEEIKLQVPTGSAITGWDQFKDRDHIKRLNFTIGKITGQNPAVFTQMDMRDIKVVHAVTLLFLGS